MSTKLGSDRGSSEPPIRCANGPLGEGEGGMSDLYNNVYVKHFGALAIGLI